MAGGKLVLFRYVTVLWASVLAGFCGPAWAVDMSMGVLRVDYQRELPISRLDEPVADLGLAGARLGNADNQTTGAFLGHHFTLREVTTDSAGLEEALAGLIAKGIGVIVTLANKDDTLRLADWARPGALIINAGTRDTGLRSAECRSNLLHTSPSRAMLADGVAQFAIWKKWPRWVLIHGSNPRDLAFADALRTSARKFGAKIVDEREFTDTGGSRATDTGYVLVQRQIPVFTQGLRKHDVIMAADESDVFAAYLPYHTWQSSTVMGSAGLRAVSFTPVNEAYGAAQFHTRFERLAGRFVRQEDFDAWVAVRAVGEAVTRTTSADPAILRAYLLSDAFELASFKGGAVSFRPWNGQLRQPVILSDTRMVVSISPQEGFLHQFSPLDTMGLDQGESQCAAFQ